MITVKAETEQMVPVIKENGGYVLVSDHSVPFENMTELASLAHELKRY